MYLTQNSFSEYINEGLKQNFKIEDDGYYPIQVKCQMNFTDLKQFFFKYQHYEIPH